MRDGEEELDFFGLHVSGDGVSLQQAKHKALMDANPPSTPSEVHSFLGLASYCQWFIPNFATIVAPLRELIKKTTKWEWNQTHSEALQKLKTSITDRALKFFDTSLNTEVTTDASPVGVAAVMAQYDTVKPQEKHIVLNISRSLSDVERRYAQVEREALAVVWACERLHLYLYGREFELVTDNKVVELIFSNPSSKPKARIERWALRLLPYKFKIRHCAGKTNIADYMSRDPVQSADKSDLVEIAEAYVNMVSRVATPRAVSRSELVSETARDEELQQVKLMIGGKSHVRVGQYAHVRDELTTKADGLVLRANQIVIPAGLRERVTQIAHSGHCGIVKMKKLLRTFVWFPQLDRWVEQYVAQCRECQLNTPARAKTPCQMSPLPEGPWLELSMDFFGPMRNGRYVMVLIADYSRYPVAKIISSTSAATVTRELDEIFSSMGIPDKLKSDNGPPFSSHEFAEFAKNQGFKHRKITPLWPQANGMCERFMKNLGKILRSAVDFEAELRAFLRNYRSTPHESTGISPNKLILRTPASTALLPRLTTTQTSDTELDNQCRAADKASKIKMKDYNDKERRPKPQGFKIGDTVVVQQARTHKDMSTYRPRPMRVVKVNCSLVVARDADGREVCRNSSMFKLYRSKSTSVEVETPDRDREQRAPGEESEESGGSDGQSSDNEFETASSLSSSTPSSSTTSSKEGEEENQELRRSTREKKQPERYGEMVPSDQRAKYGSNKK